MQTDGEVIYHCFIRLKNERFFYRSTYGYVGIGYWNGFKLHYDTKMTTTWTIGGNFYWPRYNTQFSLKGERYLLGEKVSSLK